MLTLALAIRFLLEICLVAVAIWLPYQLWPGPSGLVFSATAVAVLLLTWGTLLSPKRRVELGAELRLSFEMALFGLAAIALYSRGHWPLAIGLTAIASADKLALFLLEGRL